MKEKIAWLWFHELKGFTLEQKKQLLSIHHSPLSFYFSVANIKKEHENSFAQAEILYNKSAECGIDIFTIEDASDAGFDVNQSQWPLVIYYMGKPPLSKSVALIGTRDLSAMGYYFIQEILEWIKSEDKNIYAGFAAGVEKVAIEGAIKNGIQSTAVLTHGLDACYPKRCWHMMEKLKHQGTLVSPFPFGSKPNQFSFAIRNQLYL